MSAGEWLVEMLAWAAFETYWRDYHTARADRIIGMRKFIEQCPRIETWDAMRVEHQRRQIQRWGAM